MCECDIMMHVQKGANLHLYHTMTVVVLLCFPPLDAFALSCVVPPFHSVQKKVDYRIGELSECLLLVSYGNSDKIWASQSYKPVFVLEET